MLTGESPPAWIDDRSDATIVRIAVESTTYVDDIAVTIKVPDDTATRIALVQAKTRLLFQTSANSQFAATVDQIVAQVTSREMLPSLARPFTLGRDRVVLLVGPTSSRRITDDLATALATVRTTGIGLAAARRKLSKQSQAALQTLLDLVRHAWAKSTSAHITEPGLVRIVRAIYVGVLPDAHETPSALGRVVRGHGRERRAAWHTLVRLWSSAAEIRGEYDRESLREKLRDEGVALLPDPDLAGDIDRLRTITNEELTWVSSLATIRFRDRALHVDRACTARLIDATRRGGIVVVGDPGAGKSGVLHDAVTWLRQSKRDVVFVTTERLVRGISASGLMTLGLDHALIEVLAGWTGPEAAFLVIDAIDASRSTDGLARLLTLLAHLKLAAPRWTQVVSIRRFDLRCSGRMQDLFHGSAPDQEFADPNEFRNVAHFLVPGFTPDEVDRLAVQSPELLRAARAVLAEMGDRIWVPFHLRLLAAVVETMPDTASMPSVPTAGRLLDLYWERCVVRRKDGEGAQSAKRLQAVVSVVRSMLRRKRLLLRDTEIATKWSSQIHILISDGVLVEGQAPGTRSVHFAHHALFDYIAARTSLAVDDPATLSRLAADPETALAFRPSLSLSFQRLWDVDASRRLFWDAALSWRANLASASLWLVPAVVAARSFQDPVDLEPLRRFVRASPVRASRSLAEEMLGLVIAVGVNGNCAALVGRNQASWCELARVLAAEAMPRIAWSLRFLLFNLVAQLREMTAPEVASTGAASRSLLQYATIHDERLIESALKCVALTSGSNAAETSVAIDPLLSRKQIESRGYRTLHTLSFHISPVIQASPELAGRIYEAAYTYEETSREPTAMGDSQIISMTSNRKQDFDGARYQLAEKFHELAAIDLALASRVVRRAFGVVRGSGCEEAPHVDFALCGRAMRIREDGSTFRVEHRHLDTGDPERLLRAWRSELERIHERPDRDARLASALDELASEFMPARVLQVLLAASARENAWLGRQMREVTWSSPLLGLRELSLELAQFLRAIYPHMASDEQEAVDRAVLSLPEFDVGVEDVAEEHRSQLRRGSRRAMFLGSIGAQARSLACRESIARLQLLLSPASLPVDHTMLVRRDLTDGGTLPAVANPPADDHLAALTSAVAARASAWQNVDVVSADDLERAEMDLAALEAALASESVSSGGLRRHAFTALSDACSHAACAPALRDRPRLLGVVVSVLLRAEGDPAPRGGDSAEAQYASAPSWSSPAPRIDAAVSLPVLLGRTDCDGRQELVRAAVRRLAFDPSPAVRGQLTRRLPLALPVEAILVRSLASELIETERQHDVVLQCLQCVGQGVVRTENGDGLDLVRRAWDRAPTLLGKDAAGEVRSACAGICMGRHLVVGDGVGQDIVDLVANDPGKFHVEASGLAGDLREEIAQLDGMDATLARVGRRQRAIVYFARLCRAASNQFREWVARPSGERDADVGRNLVRLLDHLAYQVLFASGEHGSTAPTDRAGPLVVELTQSIESIADAGLVPASHTLLKTLRFLRPSNPAAVLCMASRTVVRARDSGLGFEQLAADEAVAIVETVLVEHREVLRGSSASARRSRTDLIAMLDVFVEGAWPHALALTSRLHEAFV